MKFATALALLLLSSCGGNRGSSSSAIPNSSPKNTVDEGGSTSEEGLSQVLTLPSKDDVEMYFSASDSGFKNGDPVNLWKAIDSEVSAAQESPGYEPIFQKGSSESEPDAVTFDGVDDFLVIDESKINITNGFTIIMAIKVNVGATHYLLSRGYDDETRYRFYFNASGQLMYDFASGGSAVTANITSSVPDQTWSIISFKMVHQDNMRHVEGRLNGSTNGSSSQGPFSWPDMTRDLVLGANTPSGGVLAYHLDASIAQMVIYDANLSLNDIEAIECSLSEIYQIAVNNDCE